MNVEPRWRLTEDLVDAGVWPWQLELELERSACGSMRHRGARVVAVDERHAAGQEARDLADAMGLADADAVRCIVLGPEWVLVLRAGGRELLPAIATV